MSAKKPDRQIRDFSGPRKKAAIPREMARTKPILLFCRQALLTEKTRPVKAKSTARTMKNTNVPAATFDALTSGAVGNCTRCD
jgi:hypothetical protein